MDHFEVRQDSMDRTGRQMNTDKRTHNSSYDLRICFNCGESGHIKPQCKNLLDPGDDRKPLPQCNDITIITILIHRRLVGNLHIRVLGYHILEMTIIQEEIETNRMETETWNRKIKMGTTINKVLTIKTIASIKI